MALRVPRAFEDAAFSGSWGFQGPSVSRKGALCREAELRVCFGEVRSGLRDFMVGARIWMRFFFSFLFYQSVGSKLFLEVLPSGRFSS